MKVFVGTMYRIVVERKCGCRAMQEYLDDLLKQPDGEPTYKPCAKHKRGTMSEVVKELMLEVLEQRAEEQHSKAVIAVAEANADRATAGPAPVGEGATSETRTPIKAGNAVPRPAAAPAAGATPVAARPAPPKVRRVNLTAGSGGGVRRVATPASAATAVAAHAAPQESSNSIDAELAGVPALAPVSAAKLAKVSPAAIAKVLVDDADGGLLGDPETDPSEDRSR